ncbi:VOC family protein [Roseimaritima sediminicola]|uniref:VOC family protein n=1 Tax=Roseimaritima sediminicola TaxID=2662066 RepID=UPI001298369F|nr:VOC family protein [Roseimaritima sediminicola]
MLRFAYTIVYVHDVSQTLQFYQRAFGLQTCFLHPSQSYGELDTGNTKLAFANHDLAKENLPDGYQRVDARQSKPWGVEIAFMTDDVAGTVEAARRAGATLVAAASEKPWGQTVAYVRDPDGMLIEICSPVQSKK